MWYAKAKPPAFKIIIPDTLDVSYEPDVNMVCISQTPNGITDQYIYLDTVAIPDLIKALELGYKKWKDL